jgi:hypothetical protein
MTEWDPIGVADLLEEGEPWGRDEYDGYLGRLGRMLRQGANADAIASYLARVRTGPMAGSPDSETDARVARRLVQIASERPDSIT